MQQWVWQYTCYCCLVIQLCPTLCHPVDHSPPGSSIHGISQERTLEWAVISFFRGSYQPKDRTCISCIGRQGLYHRTSREAKIFTIWSSRKNFCWSLFCSIIVVIVKVLDSSTHIFCEDMEKDYWVLYAVSSHELVWFLVFDLFYNSVSCRKLILMQIVLNCRKANKLCWVECSWLLPYEYWPVLFPMFESICKFITSFMIAYEIIVFWVPLQTSCNILFVSSWASCVSAGNASTCNVGDLGSIPGLGRFPWRRERLPTPVFWPREFHRLYSPRGRKELDTAEWLSLSL